MGSNSFLGLGRIQTNTLIFFIIIILKSILNFKSLNNLIKKICKLKEKIFWLKVSVSGFRINVSLRYLCFKMEDSFD